MLNMLLYFVEFKELSCSSAAHFPIFSVLVHDGSFSSCVHVCVAFLSQCDSAAPQSPGKVVVLLPCLVSTWHLSPKTLI